MMESSSSSSSSSSRRCRLKKTAAEEEEELKRIFREHDVNRDGHLNKEELKCAFLKLGAFMPAWRADRAIYYTDIDVDGAIDDLELEELVEYAADCGYTLG